MLPVLEVQQRACRTSGSVGLPRAKALVMGSIEQPDSIEKGIEFWDDKENVQIHEGRVILLRGFYWVLV